MEKEALCGQVRHWEAPRPRTSVRAWQYSESQAFARAAEPGIGHQSQERCKWRKAFNVEDLKTGSRKSRAQPFLTEAEEAISLHSAAYAACHG